MFTCRSRPTFSYFYCSSHTLLVPFLAQLLLLPSHVQLVLSPHAEPSVTAASSSTRLFVTKCFTTRHVDKHLLKHCSIRQRTTRGAQRRSQISSYFLFSFHDCCVVSLFMFIHFLGLYDVYFVCSFTKFLFKSTIRYSLTLCFHGMLSIECFCGISFGDLSPYLVGVHHLSCDSLCKSWLP